MALLKLVFASIVVHSILFFSVFDIYFTSPIINGIKEIWPNIPPPASRLVLFVADGLRADKFFEPDLSGSYRNLFLRSEFVEDPYGFLIIDIDFLASLEDKPNRSHFYCLIFYLVSIIKVIL